MTQLISYSQTLCTWYCMVSHWHADNTSAMYILAHTLIHYTISWHKWYFIFNTLHTWYCMVSRWHADNTSAMYTLSHTPIHYTNQQYTCYFIYNTLYCMVSSWHAYTTSCTYSLYKLHFRHDLASWDKNKFALWGGYH